MIDGDFVICLVLIACTVMIYMCHFVAISLLREISRKLDDIKEKL